MANFVFNIAKSRIGTYHENARTGTNGEALVIVVLRAAGLESDAVLIDKDTLADVLSGSTDEATNTGYSRIVLSGASVPALVVDDANDRVALDLSDITWSSVQAGDTWAKLLICYRPSTSATDAQIIPLSAHDFGRTPDGADIVAVVTDYVRES
jgi:hypothetical protein